MQSIEIKSLIHQVNNMFVTIFLSLYFELCLCLSLSPSLSLHLPLTRSEAEAGQAQEVSNKESRSIAIKEIKWEEWAELGEK